MSQIGLEAGPLDASDAFDSKLQAATVARLGGVGAISPELYAAALQDIANAVGCEVSNAFKAKVAAVLRDMPCSMD